MKLSSQYIKKVEDYIFSIKTPIVIFGASRAGWYIMKVLEYHNIKIKGFMDNNQEITSYNNYISRTPKYYNSEKNDIQILIGTFRSDTASIIHKQLKDLGFLNINHLMKSFLYYYFMEVVKRDCNKEEFAKSIKIQFENYTEKVDNYGFTKNGHFISPFVVSNITQKCSLSCIDCGQRIPYYKDPLTFNVPTIVNDIKQYAKAFDLIPEISFHGGEPLLHKEIDQICREVAKIPNIIQISFLTNGTITPTKNTMQLLKETGSVLQQSDYGHLSKNQNKIFELCKEYEVYTDIVYTMTSKMWLRVDSPKMQNRSNNENDKIYQKCVNSKICCQIMDGELFRCPVSMHGTKQGLIPKVKEDYISLNQNSDDFLVKEIRSFLTRKTSLKACNYCDPNSAVEVPPAIQIKNKG